MNDNGKEPTTSKDFVKEFDKCPACGSKERFFEDIVKELKDRGLLDLKIACFDFQLQQGFPLPPQKMAILPFGSEIPHFKRMWDTCCSCGLDYAIHLEKVIVKKSIDLAPSQTPPNRAERRRMEKQGIPPFLNNPRLS